MNSKSVERIQQCEYTMWPLLLFLSAFTFFFTPSFTLNFCHLNFFKAFFWISVPGYLVYLLSLCWSAQRCKKKGQAPWLSQIRAKKDLCNIGSCLNYINGKAKGSRRLGRSLSEVDWTKTMSHQYFCPAEYKPQKIFLNLTVRFGFWLSVYSAGQKYRWLIFSGHTCCCLVATMCFVLLVHLHLAKQDAERLAY